jgi:hypothetical protein
VVVEDLVCEDMPKDYDLRWRIYGAGGASLNGVPTAAAPGEIFIMAECLAPTAERAAEVVRIFCGGLRAQHGHRGSLRAIATTIARWTVAIELGSWRCGRSGGAAGSVTSGNGSFAKLSAQRGAEGGIVARSEIRNP